MSQAAPSEQPPPAAASARVRSQVFERSEQGVWSDLYSELLGLPLWGLILVMAGLFLLANVVFAGLYLIDPGVAGLKTFGDGFFFSVQTIANVNLGFGAPTELYTRWVVTAEAFVGLLALALATGMFFARIAKPTARVIFSRVAVVTRFEGKPALMFRAGNRRSNQILNAEVQVNVARNGRTSDGHVIRRFEELALVKSRAPLFAYSWTIIHIIDETSPLFGLTEQQLWDERAEMLVVLSGVDDRFAQSVYARCSYTPDELRFGHRFADVLQALPDGRWRVDFSRFHDTLEA
jgi:inward rectifier potassium channel